ncbi:MAG: Calx-beta domain-containing protein [Thermoanaerobaculia bacterium]
MRCRGLLLFLIQGLALSRIASAQQACPNRPAPVPGEQLGCSVAANGDVVAYGANLGNRVLISQGNGFQSLTASDGAPGDQFGFSLGIDGDTLAVGAPTADGPGGQDAGAVYVFRKQNGKWVQEAKLTASDGAAGAQLGFAVALRNGVLAAGAAKDGARGSLSGAVYVFEHDTAWVQKAKLTGARTRAFDELGAAVALDGGVLVAGAPFEDHGAGGNQGGVHLFEQRGGAWTETATLTPSGLAPGDELGFAVSIQGDTLAAGARRGDVNGRVDAGWVAVFKRDGGDWRQSTRLTAGAASQAGELFGGAVSLSGGRLLAGASQADGSHGATYLFEETTPGAWTLLARTKPPDDQGPGRFGFAVALSGETAVAGAFMANGGAGFVACETVPAHPEALPRLTVDDVSLAEGNRGTRPFAFTVSLSSPAGAGGVSFDIATAPGTARAGTDYVTRRLTRQTIPAGSSTYSFSVLVKGDIQTEPDRTFFVSVTNVTGATVAHGQGLGTILNDDVPGLPSLTVDDVSLPEGDSGTTAFPFTIHLSAPAPPGGVRFDIATIPGTATAGDDYVPKSLTGQRIAAGNSTYTLEVLVKGDITPEANETFFVKVSKVTGATAAGSGQGQGTILNDDQVADSADLSVTKVDSPDPVPAGKNLTYTITVTNAGPSSAASVVLGDELPAGTTFVSLSSPSGWSCTKPPVGSGGTVSCSTPSLAVGSAVFTLTVAVAPSTPAGAVFSNTATASSSTPDPNPGNESGTATTIVGASADLSVTQVDAPDPVTAGNNLTYTITVTNAGPSSAEGVILNDPLPAGTTFVFLSSPAGWTCTKPPVGSGGTVSCSKPSLAVGSAVFTLTVAVDPLTPDGAILANTASASSTTPDPNPGNESGSATTMVGVSADLSLTQMGTPNPVPAGTHLTYTITVTNAGPNPAAGVTLSDTLPAGTTFVSLNSPGGWSCSISGTVSCSKASVPGGLSVFTLIVAVAPSTPIGTILTNTAAITSSTADPNPGDTSATTTTATISPATLSGTKSLAGSFIAGSAVTYTVMLTNNGPSAQNDNPGNEFTDVLPPELTLGSATATSGVVILAANTVTWNGAIPAGGMVTITINATINVGVPVGATITNQGTISYDADGNGTNEASTLTSDPSNPGNPTSFQVQALPSLISGTKMVTGSFTPGSIVTYTVVLTNSDAVSQPDNPGNEFTDVLPAGLTLVSASATSGTVVANVGTNTVAWNGSIAGAGSVTITITATLNAATLPGTKLTNQGRIHCDADHNGTNEALALTNPASFQVQ